MMSTLSERTGTQQEDGLNGGDGGGGGEGLSDSSTHSKVYFETTDWGKIQKNVEEEEEEEEEVHGGGDGGKSGKTLDLITNGTGDVTTPEGDVEVDDGADDEDEAENDEASDQAEADDGDEEDTEEEDDDDDEQQGICGRHGQPLDAFCVDEQRLVCRSCAAICWERPHEVSSIYDQFSVQRRALSDLKLQIADRRKTVEGFVRCLQNSSDSLKESAEAERSLLRGKYAALRRLARAEEAEVLGLLAEELGAELRRVEREAGALRGTALRPLRDAEGHLAELLRGAADAREEVAVRGFLKNRMPNFDKLSTVTPPQESPPVCLSEHKVSLLHRAVDQRLRSFGSICVPPAASAPPLWQFARTPTMDPLTAHPRLLLSPDLRSVTCGERRQRYPDNPGRFDFWEQVLSTQSYGPGRHYWQLDVSAAHYWRAGAAYASLARRGSGDSCGLGRSSASWCLRRAGSAYSAVHAERRVPVEIRGSGQPWVAGWEDAGSATGGTAAKSAGPPASLRLLGIYVDFEAGEISFYDAPRQRLLHRFVAQGGFAQPLHAALRLSNFHKCSRIGVVPCGSGAGGSLEHPGSGSDSGDSSE